MKESLDEKVERYSYRSLDSECVFWITGSPLDRPAVCYEGKMITVARYILSRKLGRQIKPGYRALHTCDNGLCIREDHLYEGTQKQNMEDAVNRGRIVVGERHGNSKLTKEDVLDIRKRAENGGNYRLIGRRYGISSQTVSKIVRNIRWKHV